MNATYIPESFSHENNKHTQAITALKKALINKAVVKELPGKNNEGYDLTVHFFKEEYPCHVELKTNAGKSKSGHEYTTWLLETYTDHDRAYLPEWRYADVHYLIIVNRHKQQAYIYDIDLLRAYVEKNEAKQIPSGTGSGQYGTIDKKCGWGIKINWQEHLAGYIKTIPLSL